MKINYLTHQIIAAVAAVALTLALVGCDGRAKIAELHSHDNPDNPIHKNVVVSIESRTIYSTDISCNVQIDNYYSDNLYSLLPIEECGVHYRKSSESEYSNRTVVDDLTGSFAQIDIRNLTPNTSYIVTPFALNDDNSSIVYYGNPITIRTKSY